MEGWLRNLLLNSLLAISLINISANAAEIGDEQSLNPVIQPEIERMDFEESRIDPDNFEIIASAGLLSIEDFGVNPIYGFKLAYRVSEGFFVDAELGLSSAGQTSAEILLPGAPLLSAGERDLTYYLVNLGYDIFPGETFVTDSLTYNTAFYVVAGIGNTEFAGASHFTLSMGFGYRVLIADYMAIYFDVRDHTYKMDLLGDSKLTNNMETGFGIGFYF